MRNIILLLLMITTLFSCVPNKDIVYFQGNAKTNLDIKRVVDTPYRLRINDVLRIDIMSSEESLVALFKKKSVGNTQNIQNESNAYFSGYTIDKHGNIRIPNLGEVNVLGYTTLEVRKKLEAEIKKYFKVKSDIFINVQLEGFKYTIFGEVADPGQKIIFQNRVSIIDAITNSGDISVFGNRKNIEVIRKSDTKVEKFYIDLTKIEAFNSEVFYLQPNDMVYVKPLKQKTWGVGTTGLQSLTTVFSILTLITSTIILSRNF